MTVPFLPAMNESSYCPTSSPTFGYVSVRNLGHSNRCVVVYHCCLILHFPNGLRCGVPFHMLICHLSVFGISGGASGRESTCQCRRCGFDPWVGKITWSRKRQPTPVFLPKKLHGQRSMVSYVEPKRVRHDWKTEHTHIFLDKLAIQILGLFFNLVACFFLIVKFWEFFVYFG